MELSSRQLSKRRFAGLIFFMNKFSLPSEIYFLTLLLIITSLPAQVQANAFAAYRVPGINPMCVPVSTPVCLPAAGDLSSAISDAGRSKRSSSRVLASLRRINFPSNHPSKSQERKRRSNGSNNLRNRVVPWSYNSTTFPNFANDLSPDDVIESLRQFHPLLATDCSKFVKLFLCSVYSPVCTPIGVVPPCRELCERVKSDCARTVETFGIQWPESVQCSLFPSYGDGNDVIAEPMYVGSMTSRDDEYTVVIQRAASLTWLEALAGNGKICIPPVEDDVITLQLKSLRDKEGGSDEENNSSEHESQTGHQFGLWCPAEMRSPPGEAGYTFLGMQNCSPPCPNMYLSEGEVAGVRYVIIFMASLCILVTFFTLCTFLIDTKRFRYPERPIVFYALSYFAVSLIFLAGFIWKEKVACNHEIREQNTNDIIQGFTVVKGDHKQACTIMFMALYYFTVNGTIWWLILTITWLLAAGFKWGTEAIEKYSIYYHLVAWGIPALQTMAVVTFSKIEGDNISGVCFLGLYDSEGLRYLLLAPLCVYLFFGILVLFTGFFCLNRVRKSLENDEENKKKLAKFMLRIGVFSVLYIVPQIVLFTIYIVEDQYRTRWEATWFLKSCSQYRVPCPAANSSVTILADGYQPNVGLFCVKYIMTLIVALPPLFWVASKKTLLSWQIFFCRGNKSSQPPVVENNHNNNKAPKHRRSKKSSRKQLLKEPHQQQHARPRSAGDGGADQDDVFIPSQFKGSSASIAALAVAAEREINSIRNSQNRVIETKQPQTQNDSVEGSIVRKASAIKKEFPESVRRKMNQVASSGSTSSRALTPSLQKQTASLSSSTSAHRRAQTRDKNNVQQQTSSLNRREFRAKRAHGVRKTSRTASPMTSSLTSTHSASIAASSAPNVFGPIVSVKTKNTVVTLTQNNFENTVEV